MVRLIAVVGWLAVTVSIGLAKPPDGVTSLQNTPSSQASRATAVENVPPPIVTEPSIESSLKELVNEITRANKAAEQDKHDDMDLEAQRSMAASTNALVWWTQLQVLLAALGTGFLLWSLSMTRTSIQAAVDGNSNTLKAIAQEQANAQRQLRAYVLVEKCYFTLVSDTTVDVAMKIKNFGQTPAYKVNVAATAQSFKGPDIVQFDKPKRQESSLTLGPNGNLSISL